MSKRNNIREHSCISEIKPRFKAYIYGDVNQQTPMSSQALLSPLVAFVLFWMR